MRGKQLALKQMLELLHNKYPNLLKEGAAR